MKQHILRTLALLSTVALLSGTFSITAAAKKEEPAPIGGTLALDTSKFSSAPWRSAMEKEKQGQFELAKDGISAITILYPKNAGEQMKKAVRFMQDTLKSMTGADVPAQPAESGWKGKSISIGHDASLEAKTGRDGYALEIGQNGVAIRGATEQGAIYGVYGFLEDALGCVWLSDSESYIPVLPTIRLAPGNSVHKPAMAWRNVYAYEVSKNDWFQRLRLNGIGYDSKGKINQYNEWGTWCHSYFTYVDPDKYFDSHPEYFALKDGKRIRECDGLQAQLCLTNPDVLRIVTEEMRERMKKNPEALYWDFSVMDSWNVKGCECENCKRLDEAEGSGMGSLLPFINSLAREFPDKYISTLAYFHTLNAPKTLKAEKNVVIKLCSMPGSQASSYAKGETPNSKQFKDLLETWSQVAANIIVWDYVVDFQNLLMPFPNFAVQQENQAYYEQMKVSGVFHQASRENGDEMADLRAYVLSRLLWEGSSMDVNAVISKYLAACYGPAAPKIAEYMQACADHLHASGNELGLYDNIINHKDGYLSAKAIEGYQKSFQEALKLVEGNETLTRRIKEAEIPVLYAKMLEFSWDKKGHKAAAEEFFQRCADYGITEIRETNCSVEDFKNGEYQKTLRYQQWLTVKIPVIVGGSVLGGTVLIGAAVLIIKRKKK